MDVVLKNGNDVANAEDAFLDRLGSRGGRRLHPVVRGLETGPRADAGRRRAGSAGRTAFRRASGDRVPAADPVERRFAPRFVPWPRWRPVRRLVAGLFADARRLGRSGDPPSRPRWWRWRW